MAYNNRTGAAIATAGAVTIAAGAAMAITNRYFSKRAERNHPPKGDFLDVQGVRLHYVAKGVGPAVVFLHGNGSMIEDFACSGLLEATAADCRVIAFDRPGYGHSSRPRDRSWTPEHQAALFAEAFGHLGIETAVLVGHSWGTLVALALALHHPEKVKGLVLASGYYFPTARADVPVASAGAIPGLGTVLCHTLLPLISRALWSVVIKNLFSPRQVPEKFRGFPKEMAVRPSQLRASAEEAAMMIPSTEGLAGKCSKLAIPAAIVCGAGDQVVDPEHSAKLQRVMRGSNLSTLLFNGHMVHHTGLRQITAVLEEMVRRSHTT